MQSALFKFAAELRLNVFFALKLTNLIVSFSKCFLETFFLRFSRFVVSQFTFASTKKA